MFKNVKQATVNGKAVQFYMLPATKGFTTAMKLMKVMSNATEDSGINEMLTAVIDSLGDAEIMVIIADLMREMTIEGNQIDFDEYFMGNYGELVQILAVVLKENFGSFFTVDLSEIL